MSLPRRDWLRMALASAGVLAVNSSQVRGHSPDGEKSGRIFLTSDLGSVDDEKPTSSIVAINPESGDWTKILDGSEIRPRVSPDGRTLAFVRRDALWTRPVDGEAEPRKILDCAGEKSRDPVWSPDGKQIVVSLGRHDDGPESRWVFKTVRLNADGSGREELKIPSEDMVQDWSGDGQWMVTTSSRNAKIGWQLYVMRPDGSGERQVTEGGNPFYTRFSPDSRRLLYSDGTTEARRGVWVVGIDGKDRRKVFPTGKSLASACWSPDGQRIAIMIRDVDARNAGRTQNRIAIMNLDGGERTTLPLSDKIGSDMPDWR